MHWEALWASVGRACSHSAQASVVCLSFSFSRCFPFVALARSLRDWLVEASSSLFPLPFFLSASVLRASSLMLFRYDVTYWRLAGSPPNCLALNGSSMWVSIQATSHDPSNAPDVQLEDSRRTGVPPGHTLPSGWDPTLSQTDSGSIWGSAACRNVSGGCGPSAWMDVLPPSSISTCLTYRLM